MRAISPSAAGALLATILLSASGCATKGDLRNVRNEIRGLSARQDSVLVALQRQALVTQDSLRGAADQLFEIRGSFSQQLTRILDELGTLRELTGQNQRAIASIRDQLEGMRSSAYMGPGGAPGVVSGGGGDAPPSVSGGRAAVETYNAAVTQFNRGSLNAARAAFQQFLQQYPGDELAPEAEYKLADILVQEGRLQDAIQQFDRIPQLYPAAPKVPDALYRIGVIHQDQGRRSDARIYFERVVNTYPTSAMADLANDRLRELGPG